MSIVQPAAAAAASVPAPVVQPPDADATAGTTSLPALPAPAAVAAEAPAAAPAADKKPTEQQNRMKTCNADPKAKALKGDERKKFMSECLSK